MLEAGTPVEYKILPSGRWTTGVYAGPADGAAFSWLWIAIDRAALEAGHLREVHAGHVRLAKEGHSS
jgi:hypothetical protein